MSDESGPGATDTPPPARSRIEGWLLPAAVFTSGAGFMAAEITGAKILQVYFGSTVYVWGSVIGVFLVGLALGNVAGGRLADKWPSFRILIGLLGLAGIWIALVPLWKHVPAELLIQSVWLGGGPGALLLVVILFGLPSFVMGMTTPFAVRLAAQRVSTIGVVSGRLYALSNAGSVLGALGTALVLSRYIGDNEILFVIGAILGGVCVLTVLASRQAVDTTETTLATTPETPDAGTALPVRSRAALGLLVAAAGAALMAIEIAGTLVVQIHFGSTVYVWGGMLAVFLLAMSLGSLVGGRFADTSPSFSRLVTVVVVAGLWIMLVPVWQQDFHEWLAPSGYESPLVAMPWGAVLAAVALYGVPSLILGAIVPFALRLATKTVGRVGATAGSLTGLSNLGSFAGVFLTTFVLIEFLGPRTILILVGAAIVLVCGVTALMERVASRTGAVSAIALTSVGVTAAAAAACLYLGYRATLEPGIGLIEQDRETAIEFTTSPFHHIVITERFTQDTYRPPRIGNAISKEQYSPKAWCRTMRFNMNQLESSIFIGGGPEADRGLPRGLAHGTPAEKYTHLFQLGVVFLPEMRPGRILIVGAGGLIGPRQFHDAFPPAQDYAGVHVDVVEIDAQVVRLAKKYFFPEAPRRSYDEFYRDRMHIHIEDGRQFLFRQSLRAEAPKYDMIVLDAYSAGGRIPFHLLTSEFFALARSRLRPDGVLVVNLTSAARGDRAKLFHWLWKTLTEGAGWRRDQVYVVRKRYLSASESDTDPENLVLLLTQEARRMSRREFFSRARDLSRDVYQHYDREAFGMYGAPVKAAWVRHFSRTLVPEAKLTEWLDAEQGEANVLTDNFAPVDFLYYTNYD